LDTLPIILASVIKRVTKCKELQFRNRRINETKSLPNGNTILLEIESLTRNLPNNRTNEVMPKFIFRIYTPKDARPHNILMHSGGGGPGPRDGLEPAHSQEHPTLLKHSTEIMKPINLHINAARIFIPQRDNSLLSYKQWEINCSVTFLEDLKDSRLNAPLPARHRSHRKIKNPAMGIVVTAYRGNQTQYPLKIKGP